MFNSVQTKLPSYLPIDVAASLHPWFSDTDLVNGLTLLREKRVTGFHFLRNASGAVIHDSPVGLLFEVKTSQRQGFILRNRFCGICRQKKGERCCHHMAAVVILSLFQGEDAPQVMPLPLTFEIGCWQQIGSFLVEWLGRQQYKDRFEQNDNGFIFEHDAVDGDLRAVLPGDYFRQWQFQFSPDHEEEDELAVSFEELKGLMHQWVKTAGERTFESRGLASKGWEKDTSIWMWLMRVMCILHDGTLPALHFNQERSLFQVECGDGSGPGTLCLTLPRTKTWDLFRQVFARSGQIKSGPPVREGNRVTYTGKGDVEICPIVIFEDGSHVSRQELEEKRFFNNYYFPGKGFRPCTSLPAEASLVLPDQPENTLPLLGYMQREKQKNQAVTVPVNDIPTFLAENSSTLQHPLNIVDSDILDIRVQDFPDKLVIDTFEEENDWCYLSCHYRVGESEVSLAAILEARERGLHHLPGKTWLDIRASPLTWFYELAEKSGGIGPDGSIRIHHRELMGLTASVEDVSIGITSQQARRQLEQLLDVDRWTDGTTLPQVPQHLRTYQKNGLAWLYRLYRLGVGGLLADDMGLGKTHQGLGLLELVREQKNDALLLIVCPASVVLHWADKIDVFYGNLSYSLYYGPNRDLTEAVKQGCVITTYGIVRQDVEQLSSLDIDILLLDEMQHLKNRKTESYRCIASLNTRMTIGLSGTPIENALQDLWALFSLCLPGLLGSFQEFNNRYIQPINEQQDSPARAYLNRLVHPFILRRNRQQVLTELPPVIEDDRTCELTPQQVAFYREIITDNQEVLDDLDAADVSYTNVLAIITRLKQVCNHPCLLVEGADPNQFQSGKWDLFVELIDELMAAEMKVVVFSQYVRMLDVIEGHLESIGIPACSIRGSLSITERQRQITTFNIDPKVRIMCASLLAGGTGIDLTAAQAVIHYDRWWNPAKEEQATARVHRMGQQKAVQVFRLITKGTLEEKIHNMLVKKRSLADAVICEDDGDVVKQLDKKQLAELFAVIV